MLTKGKFTRDDWNHLLCLFNISHFSSTECSEVMSKRTQKDAGEERVTAKSKPMMNLVSRCSERTPDVLASTASESPENTKYESQIHLSSWTEQHLRTERPVKDACSSSYSGWNADEKWSSQEWTSDEVLEVSVEGLNPAPHIHEQMTTSNYGYDTAYTFTQNNITLEHNAMNNMDTVAHMNVHNTQY